MNTFQSAIDEAKFRVAYCKQRGLIRYPDLNTPTTESAPKPVWINPFQSAIDKAKKVVAEC